jgi:hypothetical protein
MTEKNIYRENETIKMDFEETMQHCEKAWCQYAEKNQIKRYDEFYLFKIREELGEAYVLHSKFEVLGQVLMN